jgi:hypothetical protein
MMGTEHPECPAIWAAHVSGCTSPVAAEELEELNGRIVGLPDVTALRLE